MAISFGTAGAVAFSALNGTTVAPAFPASITANQLLVLVVGMKPSTANSGTVTTPTGWILLGSIIGAGGYTTTLGADTGDTNMWVFVRKADATETGTQTVTVGTNNVCWAQIVSFTGTVGDWLATMTSGSDIVGNSTWSVTGAANPQITAGDMVLFAGTTPTDINATTFSAHAVSATGISAWGTAVEVSDSSTGTGNDMGQVLGYVPVTTGTATAAPVWTATASGTLTNIRGPGVIVRIRESAFAGLGLSFQLDASAITGLANNAAVSSWTDVSGNARTVTQATGGLQPTYITSGLNGKPVVRFSGAQTMQVANPVSLANGYTIFSVHKFTSSAIQWVFIDGSSNGVGFGIGSAGARELLLRAVADVTGSTYPVGTPEVWSADRASSGTNTFYVANSVEVTSGGGTLDATTALTIGSWDDSAQYFMSGDIAEVLIYSRQLSSTERTQVYNYLNAKWIPVVTSFVGWGWRVTV